MWQPGVSLDQIEKEVILKALQFYQGNKIQTARALRIDIKTLYNKLDSYEVGSNGTKTLQTDAGIRMESSPKSPEKQPLSVRKREKA